MKYVITADTDIGIVKDTNQDSLCVRMAETKMGHAVMAVICDGMGGLSKGEVASAAVIKAFCKWFEQKLPTKLKKFNWNDLAESWDKILKEINVKILKYGKKNNINIGTTFVGIFLMDDKYMIFNVGDSRIYKISSSKNIKQLTEDQTLVQQEIKKGILTMDQAKQDPRKSILLQCVGASKVIRPEIRFGKIESNTLFMLCSDGFYNQLEEEEMSDYLTPNVVCEKSKMHENSLYLIDTVKKRMEKDNISIILIRTEE